MTVVLPDVNVQPAATCVPGMSTPLTEVDVGRVKTSPAVYPGPLVIRLKFKTPASTVTSISRPAPPADPRSASAIVRISPD